MFRPPRILCDPGVSPLLWKGVTPSNPTNSGRERGSCSNSSLKRLDGWDPIRQLHTPSLPQPSRTLLCFSVKVTLQVKVQETLSSSQNVSSSHSLFNTKMSPFISAPPIPALCQAPVRAEDGVHTYRSVPPDTKHLNPQPASICTSVISPSPHPHKHNLPALPPPLFQPVRLPDLHPIPDWKGTAFWVPGTLGSPPGATTTADVKAEGGRSTARTCWMDCSELPKPSMAKPTVGNSISSWAPGE